MHLVVVGAIYTHALQKDYYKLHCFKSDRGEIWQDCSTHRLMESDFLYDFILLSWRP